MEGKILRVSGLQMLVSRALAQNEKRILRAVELAADQWVDDRVVMPLCFGTTGDEEAKLELT